MSLREELNKAYNEAKMNKNRSTVYFPLLEERIMKAAQSGKDCCFVSDFATFVIVDFCKANGLLYERDEYSCKIYGWS